MEQQQSKPIAFLDLAAVNRAIRPELDGAWSEVVESSAFVGGSFVERFENEFAAYTGSSNCIGVANGTDALELILSGLGIGPGHEVLVPANTFIATAEAVVRVGATPVFVDVDPGTGLITGENIRSGLTERTVAVMAVHLYGQPVDMTEVSAVADEAGIAVIEDAAQAHGATWDGKPVGSFGVAAGFSFYPGKNLGALGDGGAITTNDDALAARIRTLANHGRSSTSRYEHEAVGRNSRLDGLQAAILSQKLRGLDAANAVRREMAASYDKLLPSGLVPLSVSPQAESVFHLYIVRCVGPDRLTVTEALDAADIGWGLHYPVACHLQPAYQPAEPVSHPVAERLTSEILSLPMHPFLTGNDVDRICEVLDGLVAAD